MGGEDWDRGLAPALRARLEGYMQTQRGCHVQLAKIYAGVRECVCVCVGVCVGGGVGRESGSRDCCWTTISSPPLPPPIHTLCDTQKTHQHTPITQYVDKGLLAMLQQRGAALATAQRVQRRLRLLRSHGVPYPAARRRRTRSAHGGGAGGEGEEEGGGGGGGEGMGGEEEEEDGEEAAFAAMVAAAAKEPGRKRLPTSGPLVTRGQLAAFVEEGLASGLVTRYERVAPKLFGTAWRHGLAFAREGQGLVEGDAEEAAVEAAWAAAVNGGAGGGKEEPAEKEEHGGEEEEGSEGEGEEEAEAEGSVAGAAGKGKGAGKGAGPPPAWRLEFHSWVLARRPVSRGTARTYCRGVERVSLVVCFGVWGGKWVLICQGQPPPQQPTNHNQIPPPKNRSSARPPRASPSRSPRGPRSPCPTRPRRRSGCTWRRCRPLPCWLGRCPRGKGGERKGVGGGWVVGEWIWNARLT